MAKVLSFPDPLIRPGTSTAVRCGRSEFGTPVHVWIAGAVAGDRCVCGEKSLSPSAFDVDALSGYAR